MSKMLGKFILVSLLLSLLVAACTTPVAPPAPTEVPTVEPTATTAPTATPVPPTATPEPTATSVPKPRLENLRFGTSEDSNTATGTGATFSVGVPAVFANIDYADLPANTKLIWRLSGANGDESNTQTLTGTVGTARRDLFGSSRRIFPGTYTLVVRTDKQQATATFTVDLKGLKSGDAIVTEPFDNNELGWDLPVSPFGKATIEDGQLTVSVTKDVEPLIAYSPIRLADIDLSMDILFETGPANTYASVIFRDGYSLDLFASGGLVVGKGSITKFEPVLTIDRVPGFKRSDINRLRVVARGSRMAFYLNDTLIGSLADQTAKAGLVALSAAAVTNGELRVSFDNLILNMPPDQVAVLPTPAKAPTTTAATAAGTPKPAATKAPAAPAAPPLADAIKRTRNSVEAIGGAMDRIYHGSGAESCGAFMESFIAIVNAPTYDVPASQQGAYAQYRQAVDYVAGSKVTQIARICLQGGGNIGALDFNEARQAVNTAGSWLTQALAALGL